MKKRERTYDSNIIIYVLMLENNCFYVGQTINLDRRIKEHVLGKGASFTKKHSLIRLIETFDTNTKRFIEGEVYEDFFTMKYMDKYGTGKVKGGRFLGSVKKRASKFKFYENLFIECLKENNPPISFFTSRLKITSLRTRSHP